MSSLRVRRRTGERVLADLEAWALSRLGWRDSCRQRVMDALWAGRPAAARCPRCSRVPSPEAVGLLAEHTLHWSHWRRRHQAVARRIRS